MGYYLNNNVCYEAYKYIAQMEYFVDKSEILEELFPVLNTENRFICITSQGGLEKPRQQILYPPSFHGDVTAGNCFNRE